MTDTHLTLRITGDLAKALARMADARSIPKSRLVRDAIAHYLAAGTQRSGEPPLLAGDLMQLWDALPHLAIDEATQFDTDLRQARAALAPPDDAWA